MDFSKVNRYLFQKISESHLPSVTAALVKGDDLIWTTALGFKDLEKALPATQDTLYGIGSVTKSFTAISILQLAEAGKLNLDDPVEKYIPFSVKPFGEPICIKHFLSHTSGIPALAMSESASRSKTGSGDHWLPVSSYEDLLTFMQDAQDWVVTHPGERWFYMNEGYILLGKIIEVCSGQSYFEYVRDHILQPLGMTRTCYFADQLAKEDNAAMPYVITDKGKCIPSVYPYTPINSKGGLISSVIELSKYLSMYLSGGMAQGCRVLSKQSLSEMVTPRIITAAEGGYFGETEYGYGMEVTRNFLGHRLIGHGGSVRVSTAYIGYLPEDGYGVAILANGAGYSTEFMAMYVLAAALGEDPDDLPFVRNEKLLKNLSGNYRTYQGTTEAIVRKAGDMLMVDMPDRHNPMTLPLYPYKLDQDPVTFYAVSGGARTYVEFYRKPGQTTMIYERYAFRKY